MTISEIVISTALPAIEVEILLAEVLEKDRSFLHAHPEFQLSNVQEEKMKQYVVRREKSEPIAYIIGHREFYGMDFKVTPDTLIPRPETEDLIEEVDKLLKTQSTEKPIIVELGTGSGAIAIVLAKKFPNAEVIATDISEKALEVAKDQIMVAINIAIGARRE